MTTLYFHSLPHHLEQHIFSLLATQNDAVAIHKLKANLLHEFNPLFWKGNYSTLKQIAKAYGIKSKGINHVLSKLPARFAVDFSRRDQYYCFRSCIRSFATQFRKLKHERQQAKALIYLFAYLELHKNLFASLPVFHYNLAAVITSLSKLNIPAFTYYHQVLVLDIQSKQQSTRRTRSIP